MIVKLQSVLRALQILLLVNLCQTYSSVSDETLRGIRRPAQDFDIKHGKLLAPILRPRVPGSEGSTAVRNHFLAFFSQDLPQWTITLQNSTSKTPLTGTDDVPFINIIASRDPPWSTPGEVGYLTLVAHYDSKIDPEGFIGATDSAAPCAMLMHAARTLDGALTRKWATMHEVGVSQEDYDMGLEEHKGIQIILLDGEEAFDTWTAQDSIYGSRSLAAEMEATFHPALSTYRNAISSIHLFMLLDLLGEGTPNPTIPSYFKTTHWAYQSMATLEDRLREQSLFVSSPNHPSKRNTLSHTLSEAKGSKPKRSEPKWFYDVDKSDNRWMGGLIEDDHMPFMARGVDIFHIIPAPFPTVWHKAVDDGEHLDLDTVGDWTVLVTAFAAEWLDLEGSMDKKSTEKRTIADKYKEQTISKTEL